MSRYAFLERQLDRDDLTDEEFNEYNRELNHLQDEANQRRKRQDEMRATRLKEEEEERALEKVMSLTEAMVDKMYEDTCLRYQDVNGMSFKAWYEQSLKYYFVDDSYNVHSKARSDNTVEIIPHPSQARAKFTILKRIKYKFYDHAVRGHDFAWEINE